jgi:hypothetical protein
LLSLAQHSGGRGTERSAELARINQPCLPYARE